MKRKITAILTASILLLSLFGCAEEKTEANDYASLVTTLAQTVDAMFDDGFEAKAEEGEYPSPTGELEEKWKAMLLSAKDNFMGIDENAFGYRLVDINGDSVPEFFFSRSDDTVLAVFALKDRELILLDAFSSVYQCKVTEKGELYTLNMDMTGGYQYEFSSYNASAGALYPTAQFGTENNICYELVNGVVYTSSEDRVEQLTTENPFRHGESFTASEFNLF